RQMQANNGRGQARPATGADQQSKVAMLASANTDAEFVQSALVPGRWKTSRLPRGERARRSEVDPIGAPAEQLAQRLDQRRIVEGGWHGIGIDQAQGGSPRRQKFPPPLRGRVREGGTTNNTVDRSTTEPAPACAPHRSRRPRGGRRRSRRWRAARGCRRRV